MITTNKDLRKVLKEAEHRGWEFTSIRNHIRGTHVSGRIAIISKTPSDYRFIKNVVKDLKT